MKATELRIGNFIISKPKYDEQKEIQVSSYGIYSMEISMGTEYLPIPLTEEWLLKFGFKVEFYGGQGNVIHYGKLGSIEVDLLTGMYDDGKNVLNQDNPIKYVHQLQNLYFALTGKELQIK